MKIIALIAQYLLALMFIVFGLNGFLHFIPQPPPENDLVKQFGMVMTVSHYLVPVFAIQVLSGVLFAANRYIPLALTLIAPVLVNILIFHITMAPKGLPPGVVATLLWFVVFFRYRKSFAGLFRAKPAA